MRAPAVIVARRMESQDADYVDYSEVDGADDNDRDKPDEDTTALSPCSINIKISQ